MVGFSPAGTWGEQAATPVKGQAILNNKTIEKTAPQSEVEDHYNDRQGL